MQDLVVKIMPIGILILVGYFIRISKFMDDASMAGVRSIVIKVGVPLLLFRIFFQMQLRSEYGLVVVVMIIIYFLAWFCGIKLRKLKILNYKLLPYITTGFAFGMLGVPLFQAVFGETNLGSISVLGIAQELFVWIILVSLLKFEMSNEKLSGKSIVKVLTTPLILCVLAGVILNILNVNTLVQSNFIFKGIYSSIEALASIVSPLLLVIVGYSLVIRKDYLLQAIKYVLVRLVVVFVCGYSIKRLVLDRFISDPFFDYAFFTLLILPPNLSIQVVASDFCEKEDIELGSNIVAVSILACIILFMGYVVILSSLGKI